MNLFYELTEIWPGEDWQTNLVRLFSEYPMGYANVLCVQCGAPYWYGSTQSFLDDLNRYADYYKNEIEELKETVPQEQCPRCGSTERRAPKISLQPIVRSENE